MDLTFLTKTEESILNATEDYGGHLRLKSPTEIDGTLRVFVSG